MPAAPWRVAIISVAPRVVADFDRLIRASGHEPAVVITQRRDGRQALSRAFAAEGTESLDLVFAAAKGSCTTVEIHHQVRAWSFVPPVVARGPLLERNGDTVRVVRFSLSGADGGEPLECADGRLWILETEPA